jgi:hypothetical protein
MGQHMGFPRVGVWRPFAGRRGSNTGDSCDRMWRGLNGEKSGSVAVGPGAAKLLHEAERLDLRGGLYQKLTG